MSGEPKTDGARGFSGAWLVVGLLGTVALLVGTVLVAFAVFEPQAAPCADGELAENEVVDDRYVSRTEEFETVRDAEAFICHDVPELHAEGWELEAISAERSVPIERLVEGRGEGVVTLGYVEEGTGRTLTLEAAPYFGRSSFAADLPEQPTEERVRVAGVEGTAYRFGVNPDQVEVLWREETLEHRAAAMLDAGFSLDDLLTVLDTLE